MRALIIATVCFPLFRIHDGEGQVILTWKAWQVFFVFGRLVEPVLRMLFVLLDFF